MFIEIRLCNTMTYIFTAHVKIIKIYMVKFNISILNRLKIMAYFVNGKYIHKHNVISKNCSQTSHYFGNFFFTYLNPTSYLKLNAFPWKTFCI